MAKQKIVGAKVKGYKDAGIDVGQGGVIGGDGTFYYSKADAQFAATKYKRKLLEIDGPEVTGWLVLNEASN